MVDTVTHLNLAVVEDILSTHACAQTEVVATLFAAPASLESHFAAAAGLTHEVGLTCLLDGAAEEGATAEAARRTVVQVKAVCLCLADCANLGARLKARAVGRGLLAPGHVVLDSDPSVGTIKIKNTRVQGQRSVVQHCTDLRRQPTPRPARPPSPSTLLLLLLMSALAASFFLSPAAQKLYFNEQIKGATGEHNAIAWIETALALAA